MTQHLTHWRLLALAGIVITASLAGGAFAAFPDTNVDTYTGCLNTGGTSGGQISQVASGLSPLKACGSNQKLVHLSGGDITKVTAGAGLSGGGDNGVGTTGSLACAATPGPSVWTAHSDDVVLNDGDGSTVATLSLPAGTYLVL